MGEIADLANKMTPYLKVLPGQKVSAVYKGFKVVPSQLNPDKDVFRYQLEVDGVNKTWDNGKMAVAMTFDLCNKGDIVEISNDGDEKKGIYFVKILVGKNASE